jgi:DNA-binding NtrC family response regulator
LTDRPGTLTAPSIRPGPPSARREWSATILYCPIRSLVGQRLSLERGLRVGRDRTSSTGENDELISIDDAKMSRRHAKFTRNGLVIEVQDQGSKNGTSVNGPRLKAPQVLAPGDIVRMGDTIFVISDLAPGEVRAGPDLVGADPAFAAAVEAAERVAASSLPVLILGETGTGKDVLARHIHARSGRKGAFVAVNCAALQGELVESALFGHLRGSFSGATADRSGFFVEAHGGTLFLDEVAELATAHQAKLLRALDAHEIIPVGASRPLRVDVRVIAATNADLLTATTEGRFRDALRARLTGAMIAMPPLRARRGDILALAEWFLGELSGPRTLSADAAEHLLLHPWPHNIRQLRMAIQHLCARVPAGGEIALYDVEAVLREPLGSASPPPVARTRAATTPPREELVALLTSSAGNVSRIAEHYGKDVKQVYRWLKRYSLEAHAFRRSKKRTPV